MVKSVNNKRGKFFQSGIFVHKNDTSAVLKTYLILKQPGYEVNHIAQTRYKMLRTKTHKI